MAPFSWGCTRKPELLEGAEEGSIPLQAMSEPDIAASRREFTNAITNQHTARGTPAIENFPHEDIDGYLTLLSSHLETTLAAWETVLCVTKASHGTCLGSKQYQFLTAVAIALSEIEKPTLHTISERLFAERVVPQSANADDTLLQLIFAALGWLTMLFEPEYPFTPARIRVVRPVDNNGHVLLSNILSTCSIELGEVTSLPVHQLIKHFGPLLPAPLMNQEDLGADGTLSDQISARDLNYHILSNVARIKVQFVSSLGLHLEFDEGTKTLKLFQFPSFCFLVCLGGRTNNNGLRRRYLKKLFENSIRASQDSNQAISEDDFNHCDFYREVLLSYRLIFDESGGFLPWLYDCFSRRRGDQVCGDLSDPLLQRLCAPKCAKEPLYAVIQASAPRLQYTASKDFPFLGRRLAVLQKFSMEQNPSGLNAMYHDNRDSNRWWTFWAVVLLGGTGVFLSVIQIIVGILQVVKR